MLHDTLTSELGKLLHEGLNDNYSRAIRLIRCSGPATWPTVVHLAKATSAVDPSFIPCLARYIADNSAEILTNESLLLLDLLERCEPDPSRVRMTLTRILSCSEDVHVRSKVTLMLGRLQCSAGWLRQQLRSEDDRVRANAVESLAIQNTPECVSLLRTATKDQSNRVAGNALLALYRLGDRECRDGIEDMASNPSPEFRATAAWVMAETADPGFVETLRAMVSRDQGRPRLHAIRALARLKIRCCQKPA